MTGYVNAIQTLGALDGPGVRFVLFMQGCPLRCCYCHNPETWDVSKGQPFQIEDLIANIMRYRPYFGKNGGVTVSGGEPLLQAPFVAKLFEQLKLRDIHTALDTSGCLSAEDAQNVLSYTDLALVDLKFCTEDAYQSYTQGSLHAVRQFLRETEMRRIPLWIRHVVIPGLTDRIESLEKIKGEAQQYKNFEHLEWLPFHNLCLEKYQQLNIPFPLAHTPPMSEETLNALIAQLV